jgi:hypothetical protein
MSVAGFIASIPLLDPALGDFHVAESDPNGEFANVIGLCRGRPLQVDDSNREVLCRLCSELGSPELCFAILGQMELSIENLSTRIRVLIATGADIDRELTFASEHFAEMIKAGLDNFDCAIISTILSSGSLKLDSEDELYAFIERLILRSFDYFPLLEYVWFEYLNVGSISRAVDLIGQHFDSINFRIWERLGLRLLLPVTPKEPSRRQTAKNNFRSILPSEGNTAKGVISYLTEKHGGNVHDLNIVTLTASSGDVATINVICETSELSSTCFATTSAPNQWICYDFKNMRVQLTQYSLGNAQGGSCTLKDWEIDGSDDGNSWITLDRRQNNSDLKDRQMTFASSITNAQPAFVRFLRLRSFGPNHCGCNAMRLSSWEVWGNFRE